MSITPSFVLGFNFLFPLDNAIDNGLQIVSSDRSAGKVQKHLNHANNIAHLTIRVSLTFIVVLHHLQHCRSRLDYVSVNVDDAILGSYQFCLLFSQFSRFSGSDSLLPVGCSHMVAFFTGDFEVFLHRCQNVSGKD